MGTEVWSFFALGPKGLDDLAEKMAFEVRRTARIFGSDACGVLCSQPGIELESQLKTLGLKKFYVASGVAPESYMAETCADAVYALVSKYKPQMLLFAANALGSEIAARLATRLGAGFISNCIDFAREGQSFTARKPIYGNDAHVTLKWSGEQPYIATVALDVLESEKGQAPTQPELVDEQLEIARPIPELVRRWRLNPQEIDLEEADFVLGVGRPIIAHPDFKREVERIAVELGAALGASRPVIDAGVFPRERQVGASGKWLNANVYLVCGVSGSSFHMMGIRGVKHLLAVNIDPGAPILQSAEVGVVGDLFAVLPALARRAGAKQPSRQEPDVQSGAAEPASSKQGA